MSDPHPVHAATSNYCDLYTTTHLCLASKLEPLYTHYAILRPKGTYWLILQTPLQGGRKGKRAN